MLVGLQIGESGSLMPVTFDSFLASDTGPKLAKVGVEVKLDVENPDLGMRR